jgi:UDP-N-acetylglucosamine--N-acetylmuramyl-(pentapeptide) pyrophosphoryl-undecaprenol N-acetylglucosamine transferase
MIRRLIVAGGGTGGHLFPGLAVVEELRRRQRGLEVLFVGTARGIEARVLPKAGEKLELLEVTPLKGQSPGKLVQSVLRLPGAMGRAASVVHRFRPDLVLGVGGYASGPILAAASALRIPTAVMEQNAKVGLTNRMLSSVVDRAYLTYPETVAEFGAQKAVVCGNPVRRAFVRAARRAETDPMGFEARSKTVLVLGGSQGARALNHVVPEALARFGVEARGLRVVHQAGQAMCDEVAATYRDLGVDAEVVPFIDDMARAYERAAVIIARAGATTLAELCAIGRPSVLIPFPHAADDHQGKNAEALAAAGAAECIREEVLTPGGLADTLRGIVDDPARRRNMADAARRQGRPDAAATIVDDLCAWLGCADASGSGFPEDEAGAEPTSDEGEGGAQMRSSLRGTRPYVPRSRSRLGDHLSVAARRPLVVGGAIWE